LSHLIRYMSFTDGFEDLRDLFEYNHQVRKNYMHSFQKIILWEDMIKNRETAWLSMKDTILHMMWVVDILYGLIIRRINLRFSITSFD
jgi:hypothetical protein